MTSFVDASGWPLQGGLSRQAAITTWGEVELLKQWRAARDAGDRARAAILWREVEGNFDRRWAEGKFAALGFDARVNRWVRLPNRDSFAMEQSGRMAMIMPTTGLAPGIIYDPVLFFITPVGQLSEEPAAPRQTPPREYGSLKKTLADLIDRHRQKLLEMKKSDRPKWLAEEAGCHINSARDALRGEKQLY